MDKDAALHAIMLSELPHVGERTAARVLELNRQRRHGMATFFRLPEAVLREDYRLHADTCRRLVAGRGDHESRCRWLADRFTGAGGAVRLRDEPTYPERLRERLDPAPAVVFLVGAPEILTTPTVAVLSSRDIDEHSVTASLTVVRAAAAHGFVLVSGGMKANHRIVAVAGRALALPRVIVLDRGVFSTFGASFDRDPFGLGPGRAALHTGRTLVLSPFRLLDPAAPRNGRRRDEMIAALADVVVAVHARVGGEIERVCFTALDRGQCVLSWQGENSGLVAAGATAVEEGDLKESLGRLVGR
jgi:predicted Rossmann fold nucleotide-binding protein DprA/Smf involved in DNA uptake